MNGITQAVFVLALGLIMGIGFMAKATEIRRQGRSWTEAFTSIEALLFLLTLLVPVALLIHHSITR